MDERAPEPKAPWIRRILNWRATREFADITTRRSLRRLSPADRRLLTEAQVQATRPIVSGVVFSGAVMLALTGLFEAMRLAPGIGYPWWLVELAALGAGGCALAIWHLQRWPQRLLLTLAATALVGVFLSIPAPGADGYVATRTGIFQLLPMALLASLVRSSSLIAMVVLVVVLAVCRLASAGAPLGGLALYWLFTVTTVAFGLLLGGYRTDYAVATFHARRHLRRQANTDALTGVLNRAGWSRYGEEFHAAAVADGRPLAVVMVDIDHFKRINDTWGHAEGDRVLQVLGRILGERQGADERVARLGGEEFVVLLAGQPRSAVEGFVQRVRRDFAQATHEQGGTLSAGIAYGHPGEPLEHQVRRADRALYQAKADGRDRVVVAPD
jgi:diguanylate cyclase (GGDEF)-like protein